MHAQGTNKAILINTYFPYLLAGSFLITFIGLFIPIMEVDASQYASISAELLRSSTFIEITDLNVNYLDKPPLLFWLSSIFIKLFGNTSLAYKLPSFILAWFSVYALFRLSSIFYSKEIAKWTSLIYASSVAFLLFTNDIRTDTLLVSFIVISVWQAACYLENFKTKHLILSSFAVGFALLAKGPIGAVVPFLALLPHVLIYKLYGKVFRWNLLLIPLILILVLSPMLLGLYQQWGWVGIRFFFWDQSFGRITGENVWKNDASYFYFLHNIIWIFLPYTILLLAALIHRCRHFFHKIEYISFFGFLLPFIALSFSHYKLPHYIYVVVPFAAMLSGEYLNYFLRDKKTWRSKIISAFQIFLSSIFLLLPLALFYVFKAHFAYYLGYVLVLVLCLYFGFTKLRFHFEGKLIFSFISFSLAALFINLFAYPKLLKYQSTSEVAFYLKENNLPLDNLYSFNLHGRALNYYLNKNVAYFKYDYVEDEPIYVFTDSNGLIEIKEAYSCEILQEFPHFSVTRLSINFLNPKTRQNTLSTHYLIQVKP
ncbi:MAG: glycosyltransferase family 39 protein [Chitinophagales bacterium]